MDLNVITDNWPWKLIWKVKLPPKIVCFTWTAMHEASLTQDNLGRRKIQTVNGCHMCNRGAETHSHPLETISAVPSYSRLMANVPHTFWPQMGNA
uniref:Reverse transcriptase zinc-binding domain-containing protein n=1 Tax=Solanum tuberosum TaxID=4113 RepID=M1AEE5_SOLTU